MGEPRLDKMCEYKPCRAFCTRCYICRACLYLSGITPHYIGTVRNINDYEIVDCVICRETKCCRPSNVCHTHFADIWKKVRTLREERKDRKDGIILDGDYDGDS